MTTAGIRDGIDSAFSFTPSLDVPGRNAVISAGQCLIKGQLWRADASVSTAIPAASAQNRYDRLVLQLNRGATSSPQVIQPVVITGTPSGTPQLPSITQNTSGLWQIPVSYWLSTSAGGLSGLVDTRQYTKYNQVDISSHTAGNDTSNHDLTKQWMIPDGDAAGTVYTIKTMISITIGQTSAQTFTIGVDINNGTFVPLATLGASFNSSTLSATYDIPVELVIVVDAIAAGQPQIYIDAPLSNTSANRLSTNTANMGGHTNTSTWVRTAPNTVALYGVWGGTGGSAQTAGTSYSRLLVDRP